MSEDKPLKTWVVENLTLDATSQLDQWKDEVAGLLSLTKTGDVVPKVAVGQLDAKTAILLQGIGKTYAEVGGLVDTATISAPKLEPVVGVPSGTIGWALSELRKEHLLISEGRGEFRLSPAMVGEAITRIKQKLER